MSYWQIHENGTADFQRTEILKRTIRCPSLLPAEWLSSLA